MQNRIHRTTGALLLALIITSAGCASVAPPFAIAEPDQSQPAVEPASQGISQTRMLIRRGRIEIVVDDVGSVADRAVALAGTLGGYVQTSREGSDDEMSMTIRVPSASLDAAMDSIAVLGEEESRRVDADDVTGQVVDLEGRVATLRATRDRLRQLLDRASGINEVITVERELHRVQAELESLDRRLIHLRGSTALADLTIDAHRPRKGALIMVLESAGSAIEWLFVRR